jgi:hypothetical protein
VNKDRLERTAGAWVALRKCNYSLSNDSLTDTTYLMYSKSLEDGDAKKENQPEETLSKPMKRKNGENLSSKKRAKH